jgi:hypothetical protein
VLVKHSITWATPQPFLVLAIFQIGSRFCPGLGSIEILPISTSLVAGITSMNHHACLWDS